MPSVLDANYLNVRRPARECLVCGQSLPELERHPTILRMSEKDEAIRQDICPTCWGKMGHQDYFSYWVTRRYQEGPTPEARRLAKTERNEALWALFNAIYARNDAEMAPQVFLVAHLLMKYRVLAFQGRGADGRLMFVHGPTQETFAIPDLPIEQVARGELLESVEKQLADYAPPPAGDEGATTPQ